MSFKVIKNVASNDAIPYVLDGSTAITKGTLLYRDTSNHVVKTATSGTTSLIVEAIADETVASGGTEVRAIPIKKGMTVEADCTSNTAATHLYSNHLLTDGATVNNTATHNATAAAIFKALRIKGAAADKKLIGEILKSDIVTA